MPSFDQAIRAEEFPPLLAYVRELGKSANRAGSDRTDDHLRPKYGRRDQ
jgi:hypothetical protein